MKEKSREYNIDDKDLAIDPVCDMEVDKKTALKRVIEGKPYYFCMKDCADTF